MFTDFNLRRYNYQLLLYMLALSIIGILVVASASNQDADTVNKQITGVCAGFCLALGISSIDYHKFVNLSILVYVACIVLLAAVLVMGHTAGGATRWINIPGIGQIRPFVLAKLGLYFFFSWFWVSFWFLFFR